MLKRLHYTLLILLITIFTFSACGGGLGGLGGGTSSEATESSLFQTGPIDIPITIAKLQAPDPSKIVVGGIIGGSLIKSTKLAVNDSITLTGQAGAIPDPITTPYVYIVNVDSGETIIATAGTDGSFSTQNVGSNGPFVVASSIDSAASQISAPVILKIDDNTYLWLLTNGDTISSGAITFTNNTVYLVATASTANLSAPSSLVKTVGSGSESVVYSLGIAGTYDEVGTCQCTIKEIQIGNEKTVVRDDNGVFYLLNGTTFEEVFSIDDSETLAFFQINDDEYLESDNEHPEPGETAAHVYMAVVTDSHIYMVDLEDGDNDILYTLAANESIVSWSWGRGVSIVLNVLNSATQNYTQYSLNTAHENNPDWTGVWDTKTTGFTNSGNFFYLIQQDDSSFLSVGKSPIAVGQTMSQTDLPTGATIIANDTAPDCAGISGEPVMFFTTWNNRSSGCGTTDDLCYMQGNPGVSAQFCDSNNDDIGDIYEIVSIDDSTHIFEAIPHPSMEMVYYCALDSEGLGQIYAYFPDDDDTIAVTEGVAHCNADNNWKVDSDTGYLVFTNASSDLESTQVDFIDASTDPRLLGN